jgi:translation initiation factor eIF-2B subunit epsilon
MNHRAKSETGVFAIDTTTSRCVHYDEISPYGQSNALLPRELFKDHSELHARSDLIDCYLDICSPDVPALFIENSDYQHIRRHFLHGILTDYQLYGKTVHVHIVNDYYMARVRSLQTYDGVSMNVMGRWSCPLCPDGNLREDQTFKLGEGSVSIEADVSLARSSTVMPMAILGTETTIGESSSVGQSTFGRNCKVGKGVVVDQSYVWDNVVIGGGCKIQSSIVASRVKLGTDCIVE